MKTLTLLANLRVRTAPNTQGGIILAEDGSQTFLSGRTFQIERIVPVGLAEEWAKLHGTFYYNGRLTDAYAAIHIGPQVFAKVTDDGQSAPPDAPEFERGRLFGRAEAFGEMQAAIIRLKNP